MTNALMSSQKLLKVFTKSFRNYLFLHLFRYKSLFIPNQNAYQTFRSEIFKINRSYNSQNQPNYIWYFDLMTDLLLTFFSFSGVSI